MVFFNSLSTRIPLALAGGALYGLLTYRILLLLNLYEFTVLLAVFVFLFYVGSRFLILFCGIDSPYYSKERKTLSQRTHDIHSFYRNTQWVGQFYHYHDIALFIFLVAICTVFLISLLIDWYGSKPVGDTLKNLAWGLSII
jgi:hypothetical protein